EIDYYNKRANDATDLEELVDKFMRAGVYSVGSNKELPSEKLRGYIASMVQNPVGKNVVKVICSAGMKQAETLAQCKTARERMEKASNMFFVKSSIHKTDSETGFLGAIKEGDVNCICLKHTEENGDASFCTSIDKIGELQGYFYQGKHAMPHEVIHWMGYTTPYGRKALMESETHSENYEQLYMEDGKRKGYFILNDKKESELKGYLKSRLRRFNYSLFSWIDWQGVDKLLTLVYDDDYEAFGMYGIFPLKVNGKKEYYYDPLNDAAYCAAGYLALNGYGREEIFYGVRLGHVQTCLPLHRYALQQLNQKLGFYDFYFRDDVKALSMYLDV
ncbi:MAG: hypothetical protein IJT08_04175, partial [Alphaproteobacteria bacterium]|nr:hypothetical protein [Alphaproteobacteria bacterium]